MKRVLFYLLGLGILATVASLVFCFSSDRRESQIQAEDGSKPKVESAPAAPLGPTVLVEKVVERPRVTRRKYVGTFEPIQEVVVVSRVSGNIVEQRFKEGNTVKAETILFELEKIRYEAALEAAVAQVAASKAEIATISAKSAQVQARLTYARNNYERNKTLYEQGGNMVTKDTVENIKSILDVEIAAERSIEAERLAAKAKLDAAEASLKLAKDDMGHTTIHAMISGRVGRVQHTVGNYITPASGPLVTVVQMDPIYLRFSVSEKDFTTLFGNVDNLRKTSMIRIELAGGEFYKGSGEIAFIDNQMSSTTNTLNIWATFRNEQELLNPGGVATVYLDKNEEVLLPAVRESAVMFDGRHHMVYVVGPGNVIEPRPIEIFSSDGEYQTVTSGVKPGETIVIDGMHKIRMLPGPDGKIMPVTVVPTETPTIPTEKIPTE